MYFENRIKPQLIQQKEEEARKKQEAIIKIQNALRVKEAKRKLSNKKVIQDAFKEYQVLNTLGDERPREKRNFEKLTQNRLRIEEEEKLKAEQIQKRIEAYRQNHYQEQWFIKNETIPKELSQFQLYEKKRLGLS
jgi:hypothetical protein